MTGLKLKWWGAFKIYVHYLIWDSNLRRSQTPERINSTVYAETQHDRIHPRIHWNSENSKTTKTTRIIRRRELIHKRTNKRHLEHHNKRRVQSPWPTPAIFQSRHPPRSPTNLHYWNTIQSSRQKHLPANRRSQHGNTTWTDAS